MLFSRIASGLIGGGILGLRATIRIEEIHMERERGLRAKGVPFIYTLWHGRMVLCILAHLHEDIVTMASRSKDGEIIARWLERNGYVAVRGSTGKGGREALQEMVDYIGAGHRAALTIDGPKGPPRAAQLGILQLARKSGGVDPAVLERLQPAVLSEVLGPVPRPEAVFQVRRGVRRALPGPAGDVFPRGAPAHRGRRGRGHPRGGPRRGRRAAPAVGTVNRRR